MQVQLAEMIRKFRREKNLTQEQLAEAMGVTVGAVSKWESAASTPDVSVIMELADFFCTSVDVLLGYRQQSGSLADTLKNLSRLRKAKEYEEGKKEAQKAVKRFPNNFDAVFQSASLLQVAGLEQNDPAASRRAEELYNRALELFGQNTDPDISQVSIRNSIACIAIVLGEMDRGIELLKQNNVEGLNNARIGQTLAQIPERRKEADIYPGKGLLDTLASLVMLCNGYVNFAEGAEGEDEEELSAVRELTLSVCRLFDEIKRPGTVSVLDKFQTAMLIGNAVLAEKQGLCGEADAYLGRAHSLAGLYDASPEPGMENIRLLRPGVLKTASSYDDFGQSAREGAEKMLRENVKEYPRLLKVWEGYCDEKE